MTDPLHLELLALAQEAAHKAGALLRDGRPADLAVAATKSSPIDVVTEMDIAAEKLITDLISEQRPDDGFLGEEGASVTGTSGVRWVIDPLDGTVNYLYGLPTWSVSIAAELHGETVAGVVAVPMRGETFHAVLGGGAWATGAWEGERRLACRAAAPLEQALHGAGLSVEVRAALGTRDRHLLETVLGANNVCCLIHVPDVEEAADAPAKQDPARAAA